MVYNRRPGIVQTEDWICCNPTSYLAEYTRKNPFTGDSTSADSHDCELKDDLWQNHHGMSHAQVGLLIGLIAAVGRLTAPARKRSGQCLRTDRKIKTKRLRIKIGPVTLGQFHRHGHVDAADLRKAGHTWPCGEDVFLAPLGDDVGLIGQARARTDKGHVATENVKQLWQFVELGFADKSPGAGEGGCGNFMRSPGRRSPVHGS